MDPHSTTRPLAEPPRPLPKPRRPRPIAVRIAAQRLIAVPITAITPAPLDIVTAADALVAGHTVIVQRTDLPALHDQLRQKGYRYTIWLT